MHDSKLILVSVGLEMKMPPLGNQNEVLVSCLSFYRQNNELLN